MNTHNVTPDLMKVAIASAREAGGILQDWVSHFSVSEKGPQDLVTDADLASQKAIQKYLQSRFPDHHYLGEEGLSQTEGKSPFRWIIDPLDGTSNYVHQFPFYAVSIGLEYEGKPYLGVIYDPNRDEMFTGIVGEGAYCNDVEMKLSQATPLSESLVVASLPRCADRTDPAVARFLNILPLAQHVQRTGSAALNLAYVAANRLDGFWSTSLKPWDQSAGVAILLAAGGVVTKMDSSPFDVDCPDLLACSNPTLQSELSEQLCLVP
ncbi:Inositol-1-monophosphatase [Polystyrenella longa]|uniref:Inositol-1-monophosphatase n=1 Tax=Polystyrenella longa TaxID=2528007 RepID=A0A518CKF5_9PLAN|nr:inositol monophosphatase family protein [Polystyrenella longa]QDU79708.1 Inositol-1-monophosphatase [Polystyrenella longa]